MCTSQQWQEMKPGAHFMSRRGAARLEAVALHRLVVSPRRVLQRQSVRDNYDVEAALIRRGVMPPPLLARKMAAGGGALQCGRV